MSSGKKKIITKETIKRLVADIKDIRKNPLTDHGIYYNHDSDDMLKGYAMIIGPEDTPYEGGYYFFKFKFPSNYPHAPPKVSFYTNGYNIRMHPNLYKNKKVCLSILNTWHGESWTGCQTISSILLTICSILTENPLLHEPGVSKSHIDVESYNQIINFMNIKIATIEVLASTSLIKKGFKDLLDIARDNFLENYNKKLEIFEKAKQKYCQYTDSLEYEPTYIVTNLYTMQVKIDYNKLKKLLEDAQLNAKEVIKVK
uniref:Ubiquitin-conjugating enzyme E2 Z n=1 Tax=viral metagenome TaxID=1070528 RepID=A0A6C0JC05_9ZZZZ